MGGRGLGRLLRGTPASQKPRALFVDVWAAPSKKQPSSKKPPPLHLPPFCAPPIFGPSSAAPRAQLGRPSGRGQDRDSAAPKHR
eukprot:6790116-Pyramimonas_sp.AAC.1